MGDGLASQAVLRGLHEFLDDLEALYKDIHSHRSCRCRRSARPALAAEQLKAAGFEVTEGVGGTGVVGLLKNGDGPTVMLRADMDALPVREDTGLPYASTLTAIDPDGQETPVMHACSHDMHVTWLAGASVLLADAKDPWDGTLMAVFQPAEEVAAGAQAMIDDGLFERFPKPDVILGQHVMPMTAGIIASKSGVVTSAGDSFQIRLFGRGAHGSMPQASRDHPARPLRPCAERR
jgi:amidohydrolase